MRMKATKMLRLIGANSSHHRHLTCLECLNSKSQYRSKSHSTHLGSSMQSRTSYRHNGRLAARRKSSMTAGVSAGRHTEVRWRDRPYLPGAARRWLAAHAVHRDRRRLGRLRAARSWCPSQPGPVPVERGDGGLDVRVACSGPTGVLARPLAEPVREAAGTRRSQAGS